MQVDIVNNTGIEQIRLRAQSKPPDRFEQVLAATEARHAGKGDEARKAAEQFVASALVLPLLSQMRSDPFRSDLFHAGFAEDAFQSQLDTVLADRITRRADFPLVDSVLNHVLNKRPAPARVNTDE